MGSNIGKALSNRMDKSYKMIQNHVTLRIEKLRLLLKKNACDAALITDEDSIYYLMTRGLSRKESIKLLVNGFLNEIIDSIKSNSLKNFIHKKLEEQLYEPKKH